MLSDRNYAAFQRGTKPYNSFPALCGLKDRKKIWTTATKTQVKLHDIAGYTNSYIKIFIFNELLLRLVSFLITILGVGYIFCCVDTALNIEFCVTAHAVDLHAVLMLALLSYFLRNPLIPLLSIHIKITFDHRVNHTINEVLLGLIPLNFSSYKLHSEKSCYPLLVYKGITL